MGRAAGAGPGGLLDVEKVTEHLAILEDALYEQELESLCQMVQEDYSNEIINVEEFAKVYPKAIVLFLEKVGGTQDSPIERAAVNQAFRNADGTGDIEQVIELVKKMKDVMFDNHFERLCDRIDSNQNNVIDFKEFEKMYPIAAPSFFRQLDANSDQVLSRDELKQMF